MLQRTGVRGRAGKPPQQSARGVGGIIQGRRQQMSRMRRWLVAGGVVICIGIGGPRSVAVAAGHVEAGATLYRERCSLCHGADGKAATPMAQTLTPKPRNHTDGAYMNRLSDEHIAAVIKNGGAAVGKSP